MRFNGLTLSATMADSEYVTYSQMKIDSEVLPLAKAAAALREQTLQEWLSDMANEQASRQLGRKPIKRRPVEPKETKTKGD